MNTTTYDKYAKKMNILIDKEEAKMERIYLNMLEINPEPRKQVIERLKKDKIIE